MNLIVFVKPLVAAFALVVELLSEYIPLGYCFTTTIHDCQPNAERGNFQAWSPPNAQGSSVQICKEFSRPKAR